MPHPWVSKGRYDGAEYDLAHMATFTREIACSDGQTRPVEFRFCYHCFTETGKATDFRRSFADPNFPQEQRVFCPHRWFLSCRLREFLGEGTIDRSGSTPEPGFQWRWWKPMAGISHPYLVHLKFGVPVGDRPIIVNINSAYIDTVLAARGTDSGQRFDALLTYVATKRQLRRNP